VAFTSKVACECSHFKRSCPPPHTAPCYLAERGSCKEVKDRAVCAAALELKTAWKTREECCVLNYDFWSEGCNATCWVNPQKVVLPPALKGLARPKPSRPCVQVGSGCVLRLTACTSSGLLAKPVKASGATEWGGMIMEWVQTLPSARCHVLPTP
jgi:hypothetical protein